MIIDMDEVIADPMGAMIDWYVREYGGTVDLGKMQAGSWSLGFPETHRHLIRERLHQPGFFRHLPVMPDSIDVLGALNGKYELFIVSAATEFPNSLKDKHDWLLEHFPFLGWRQLVLCGDKRLITGDHMIDDHVRNLEYFPGHRWLYSSPHNLSVTGYDRILDWKHAAQLFL
jgi:5'(3')-deoxyribonucleotidase